MDTSLLDTLLQNSTVAVIAVLVIQWQREDASRNAAQLTSLLDRYDDTTARLTDELSELTALLKSLLLKED